MKDMVNVIVVDDDSVDLRVIEKAFRGVGIQNPIHFATDGLMALELLRGRDALPPMRRPYLILLDLKMPRMNGIEFLAELRRDPSLRDSIVFVFTTSAEDRDKLAAYQHCIAGYIVKSHTGDEVRTVIPMLKQYLESVEFPPPPKEARLA